MDKTEIRKIAGALVVPFVFVVICWIVWLADTTYNLRLFHLGIHPQDFSGLQGILFAPFIHDAWDVSHILNNTTPFLFLGWALFYFYREIAWQVFFFVWFFAGFWVWLTADEHYHIGASGILYGLASFLFYSGVIRRQTNLMGLTLLVTFLYGGMIWGIFPYDIRVSWQSHLFGGIAGLIFAIYYRRVGIQREKYEWEKEEISETFSELNKRHEDVLSGKIEEPNLEKPEEKNPGDDSPGIKINYQYKPKDT